MGLQENLLSRLLDIQQQEEWSDTRIASEIGISAQAWSNWKSRGRVSKDAIEALLERFPTQLGVIARGISEPSATYKDKVFVARVNGARLSAGAGEVLWDWEEIDNSHAFRREWMTTQGLRAERCKLYDVRGESMAPTVNDGDTVLINMADREPVAGEVYALVGEDGLRIKRLQKRAGSWYMCSDNQMVPGKYPDEAIADNYAIIGRVVWKAGRV